MLSKEEGGQSRPYTDAFQNQMYCKTWDVPVMTKLPAGKDLIMPGEDCTVSMIIRKQIVSSMQLCIVK